MKVILLRDVAKIGRRHSVVEVPDGFALNQLIPKKWAEAANPVNLKKIAHSKVINEVNSQNNQSRFEEAIASLTAAPLQVVAGQVNEQGHLFKAVHEQDIVDAAKQAAITIERSEITIEQPIKSLGQHTITLKHGSKKVPVIIEIIKSI